ncbi:MAG: DinB family protein [Thermoanaerobaculia bacterium]|nr:DinB family protein [Thermoanaerobaculia bacterium]
MLSQAFIQELEQETVATRRLLERLPADRLDWRPHPKSMSLGQLALHVAEGPASVAEIAKVDEAPLPNFGQESATSPEHAVEALEESTKKAKEILAGFDDDSMAATWRVVHEGNEVMAMPRVGLIRSILLNHWYHHRGQLTVYLRLLDVPLPSVYGPSADENPFAQ